MDDIILKLLEEVDPDIKEVMLNPTPIYGSSPSYVPNYKTLVDPVGAIINWQRMRNERKVEITGTSEEVFEGIAKRIGL